MTPTYAKEIASFDDLRPIAVAGSLYGIFDSCIVDTAPHRVLEWGTSRAVSLYSGSAADDLRFVAPYLVKLDPEILDWIEETLWGRPWGVLVVATVGLAAVRKHWRRFLLVKGPEGDSLYFRFYDPRVLEVYLETCKPEKEQAFFGPITALGIHEAAEGGEVTLLVPHGRSLPKVIRRERSSTRITVRRKLKEG